MTFAFSVPELGSFDVVTTGKPRKRGPIPPCISESDTPPADALIASSDCANAACEQSRRRRVIVAKKERPGYDEKLGELICEQIADGKSLRSICKADGMPSMSTAMKWLQESPEFAARYTIAREMQAEGYADRIVELAETATAVDAHAVRVKVDAIKWVVAKLLPKKYGDRLGLDVQAGVNVKAPKSISELEPHARIRRVHALIFAVRLEEEELKKIGDTATLNEMQRCKALLAREAVAANVAAAALPAFPALQAP